MRKITLDERRPGSTIDEAARELVAAATTASLYSLLMWKLFAVETRCASCDFNGVEVYAYSGDTPAMVVVHEAECERRRKEYRASPAYQEAQEKAKRKAFLRRAVLDAALAVAPDQPTMVDRVGWQRAIEANQDPYGAAVISYARRWARCMEGAITEGQKPGMKPVRIEDVAERLSRVCDEEGITGFMFGAAVSILSQTWWLGEELRHSHNREVALSADEAERVNEPGGGALNPALLSMTCSEGKRR